MNLTRSIMNILLQGLYVIYFFGLCSISQAQELNSNSNRNNFNEKNINEPIMKSGISADKVKRIEIFIQQSMRQIDVPGVSVGILENGVAVLLKGFGVSNSQGKQVTSATPFKLGSVSKSFTALAMMQLIKEERVALDTPIVNIIPWFKSENKEISDLILVKHLLSHKSGFSTIAGNRNQHSEDHSSNALKTAVQELNLIKLVRNPGEAYQYSNANYQVLGYLLEILDASSYEKVISKRILNPLNMKNTSVHKQIRQDSSATQGYQLAFGAAEEFKDKLGRATIAQGGIYSSAEDMLKYMGHYLKHDSPVIPAQIRDKMISSEDDDVPYGYGFGWYYYHQKDYRMIYHSGISAGYETGALFSPELDIAIVVLINASSGFGLNNVSGIVSGVSRIVFDEPLGNLNAPIFEQIILGLIFMVPLLILFFAFRFIRKYNNGNCSSLMKPYRIFEILRRIVLPSVLYFGISFLLLILLPKLNGATLEAVKLFQPLVYLGIITCSVIAIGWCIIRIILIFRLRRI